MWQKQFSRKYSSLHWYEYLECLNDKTILEFIPKSSKINLIIDGFITPQTVYYDPLNWDKNFVRLLNKYLQLEHWRRLERVYQKFGDKLIKFAIQFERINLKNFSDDQLIKNLEKARWLFNAFATIGVWLIWAFHDFLPLEDLIFKKIGPLKKEDILAIFTPPKLASLFQEEIALRKLNINNPLAVKKHLDKFGWIPCVDFYEEPWDMKDLIVRQKEFKKTKPTINVYLRQKILQRYKKLLQKFPHDKKDLPEIIHRLIYLRDHRNDVRFYVNFFIKKIYQEAGQRLGLTINELTLLTDDEIVEALKNNKMRELIKKKIKERSKGYLMIKSGSQILILTGAKAIKKRKKISKV